ncbi:hypothetical protein [Streptomyces odontomachi]|uniref:hypothetical protein n=1 Tax=Streptomyces odontomachi TaxID=2944940 RepID=UPI00210B48A9|nr:hypothetical protein [Streptomyces sp. ODS25]
MHLDVRKAEIAIAAAVGRHLTCFSPDPNPTKERIMVKHASILRPRLDKVKPQDR